MRGASALVWLAAGLAVSAAPTDTDGYRPSSSEVRRVVISVIDTQLQAFRSGDIERAYSCAAIRFRGQFTLQQFAQLVKASYPEIYSSTSADFGVVKDDGGSAVVSVAVRTAGDARVVYDYLLLREGSAWRIGGVIRHQEARPQA